MIQLVSRLGVGGVLCLDNFAGCIRMKSCLKYETRVQNKTNQPHTNKKEEERSNKSNKGLTSQQFFSLTLNKKTKNRSSAT